MSRIGRMPITIPLGVTVTNVDNVITVKGSKETLSCVIESNKIECKIEGNVININRLTEDKPTRAMHGLYRALINNMVIGVTKGFERSLLVVGIGFKVTIQGSKLIMNIGYSHPVEVTAPEGITFSAVPFAGILVKGAAVTEVLVKGADKTLVGQVAANIRAKRVVEPYHGYGIRYKDEVVVIKEGKLAGK